MTDDQKEDKYGYVVARMSSASEQSKVYEVRTKDGIEFSCQCPGWRFSKASPRSCRHIAQLDKMAGEILAQDPLSEVIWKAFQKHLPGSLPDGKLVKAIANEVRPLLGSLPSATKMRPMAKIERLILIED